MKCVFLVAVLCVLVPFSLWAQGADSSQKLSQRIQNEADLLESYSSELKLNAEQVKHLQTLLTKADGNRMEDSIGGTAEGVSGVAGRLRIYAQETAELEALVDRYRGSELRGGSGGGSGNGSRD